jgi:ABC-type lipoprotein release transport system permease subunit
MMTDSTTRRRLTSGVTTTAPATFVVLPALVALIASAIPASRAQRVEPMTALRVD